MQVSRIAQHPGQIEEPGRGVAILPQPPFAQQSVFNQEMIGEGARRRKLAAGDDLMIDDNMPEQNSGDRLEEHTSELQSLMRISYAVFCLKKKKTITTI